MKTPTNAAKHPISELIEKLQKLPAGTTFEYQEGEDSSCFFGGETPDMELGTAYQFGVVIVEGFNPSRY